MSRSTADQRTADVIVVGAGPGGSSTAFHLATAGLDVVLLEKSSFPRDKVCGDGLTPRAVKQLISMGVDLDSPGWIRNKGLRIVGAGHRLELEWPELASFPSYGMVRSRMQLDEVLARHAEKAGARLTERTAVTGPVLDERHRQRRGRDRTPARRQRPAGRRRRDLLRPGRRGVRRGLLPARHRAGLRATREQAHGRRGPGVLRDPASRRRVDGVLAGAVGRHAPVRATCCPATAGSSRWATARRTSAWGS